MLITARLDLEAADARYAKASAQQPEFLREHHARALEALLARKDENPE